MKLVSVAGLVCYVKDAKKTAKFYEALGFKFDKRTSDHVSIYLNWFWIDFHAFASEDKPEFKKEARLKNKGAGQYLYIKVDNVDKFYKGLLKKKLKPSAPPRDWPWGNREFVLRDPDGYKLVFFKKI
ncbi:MAG TPA: VOC family protein [Candidatus Paceibacterota bacterium]